MGAGKCTHLAATAKKIMAWNIIDRQRQTRFLYCRPSRLLPSSSLLQLVGRSPIAELRQEGRKCPLWGTSRHALMVEIYGA
jgi:hypothetical protein